jgi:hypothetical protein
MGRNTVAKILGEAAQPPTARELTIPAQASFYARHILKGPWPEGEPVIATDCLASYKYAAYVLDGPFPLGEPAIATSAGYSFCYARYVLNKARFPPGEPAIATSADDSLGYAIEVLKKPFPLGEPAILRSEYSRIKYFEFLKKLGINLDEYFAERIASGELSLEDMYGT